MGQIDCGLYIRHQNLGDFDSSYELFYNDGRFTYCTDAYNGLTGYVCIGGRFYLKGDSITFYDLELEIPVFEDLSRISPNDMGKERVRVNSTVFMRNRPTSSNFWSLTGGVNGCGRKKVKLDPSKTFTATFFRQENDEYIEIDGERFYEEPGPD